MTTDKIAQLQNLLIQSLKNHQFIKLSFANKRDKSNDLRTVTVKRVEIKKGERLSFLYRYGTKDITKNYDFSESLDLIKSLIDETFFQADLFTLIEDIHVTIHKNGTVKLRQKAPSLTAKPDATHDKQKNRIIPTDNNIYLRELGITSGDWQVRNSKQDKYRQINKYVEIIDGILKNVPLKDQFNVVDMGAGKGYLTFALYDYLHRTTSKKANVYGVELRKELVSECSRIAKLATYDRLSFIEGTIKDVNLPPIDVLIALHACDTATDDAIFRGIASNAKVIVCAPCCHKQIRKQMNPKNDLSLITQFGILKERQSELVTDGIRALLMEAHGYKTNVFEFISTEHTPKNVLIVGVKNDDSTVDPKEKKAQIDNIKQTYGIQYHYLETLLEKQ